MIENENYGVELTDEALTEVTGGTPKPLEKVGDGFEAYAYFVPLNHKMLGGQKFYVQMKRDLRIFSDPFDTLALAIQWFLENAPAMYPGFTFPTFEQYLAEHPELV